jgi:predicted Co/Zn/Cd cation transporter (cation efflux family)
MIYLTLLVALAVFTLLDALITVVGLGVGLVELNPVVTTWGIQSWVIFRVLLLGCMVSVFFTGYRLCSKRFPKGLLMLETTLFILDSFIGAVVFSGFLAIYLKLLS